MRVALAAFLAMCATGSNASDARLSEILEASGFNSFPETSVRSVEVIGGHVTDTLTHSTCEQAGRSEVVVYTMDLCFTDVPTPQKAKAIDGRVQLLYSISDEYRPRITAQKKLFERLFALHMSTYSGNRDQRTLHFSRVLDREMSYSDFDFNSWETQFCNGATITRPIADNYFYFYVNAEDVEEFISLMSDAISKSCTLVMS